MASATTYWVMKVQFGKDWNMGIMLLPIAYDLVALMTAVVWTLEK